MKQSLRLLLYCLGILQSVRAQVFNQTEWENPVIVDLGKEAPVSFFIPYAHAGETASSLVQSLNGLWKFLYVDKPALRPIAFQQPGFDDAAWKTITVPSNWEVQGFGIPIYTRAYLKSVNKCKNSSLSL
jgi:beta-galactosidase